MPHISGSWSPGVPQDPGVILPGCGHGVTTLVSSCLLMVATSIFWNSRFLFFEPRHPRTQDDHPKLQLEACLHVLPHISGSWSPGAPQFPALHIYSATGVPESLRIPQWPTPPIFGSWSPRGRQNPTVSRPMYIRRLEPQSPSKPSVSRNRVGVAGRSVFFVVLATCQKNP